MPSILLTDRALLRLSGPDTRDFLQGLITQDMGALAPGQPLYAGLLSPQGKALFQLFLFADGADVLLDVAAADAGALARRLAMFRLRRKVAIAAETGLGVWQQWGEPCAHPADPRTPLAGSRYAAPAPAPDGAPSADAATLHPSWHAHRLALALPDADEIGHDDLLWLETNARELSGVSFTKGCYTGQENTARMHHRDRLRKRLLPLALSGPCAADAAVMADGQEAGRLRGRRHGDVQMALLRTGLLARPLTVEGAAATLLAPAWLEPES